jgi:hypothetical protein
MYNKTTETMNNSSYPSRKRRYFLQKLFWKILKGKKTQEFPLGLGLEPIPVYNFKTLFLCSLFLASVFSVNAQNDLKNWNSAQLDLSLTKKLDLRFGHLRGYNISNGFSSDFNQSSIHIDYDFTKRFSMSTGAILGSLSAADGANRFTLRGTYKTPIADILSWSNSIQGEVHSSNETRYKYRLIYITRLATKKRLDFLRLSPSVSYSLFYNIGGNPIQYYDKNEIPTVRQTPDGFHRGRLSFNLNSRITKNLSFSIYYMMQREFNLFTDDYHKINIVNPVTGKITRRFQDYNVIGTTLAFDFNLYKKKKKSTRKIEDPTN